MVCPDPIHPWFFCTMVPNPFFLVLPTTLPSSSELKSNKKLGRDWLRKKSRQIVQFYQSFYYQARVFRAQTPFQGAPRKPIDMEKHTITIFFPLPHHSRLFVHLLALSGATGKTQLQFYCLLAKPDPYTRAYCNLNMKVPACPLFSAQMWYFCY